VEAEVTDCQTVEQVGPSQFTKAFIPLQKERYLGLEGPLPHVTVEKGKERVFLGFFENEPSVQPSGQKPGKRCLSCSGRTLDNQG